MVYHVRMWEKQVGKVLNLTSKESVLTSTSAEHVLTSACTFTPIFAQSLPILVSDILCAQ